MICPRCGKELSSGTSVYITCLNCNIKYVIKDNHVEFYNKKTQDAINESRCSSAIKR
jgi:DNA-directed RNA polymerase subunit RPC12/RpoP